MTRGSPFDPVPRIAAALGLSPRSVAAATERLGGDATVPFIARYRKEAPGGLDEVALRAIAEQRQSLQDLDDRRRTVLAELQKQGKLSPELEDRDDTHRADHGENLSGLLVLDMKGALPLRSLVMNPIDQALQAFAEDDLTTRLCGVLFTAIPFAPRQVAYGTVDEAVTALYPQASAAVRSRAQQLATEDRVQSALWAFKVLDIGDAGIAIFSGLRTALSLYRERGGAAFETDEQQGVDSAMKLLGIAYAVGNLFPAGGRIASYHACPAGQAMTFYWCAVDVALPFADNLVAGGGGFVQRLLQRYGQGARDRLGAATGTVAQAEPVLAEFLGPLDGIVAQVGPHARRIAETVQGYLPALGDGSDKIAGVIATAADALPVYRYLGARVAAEAVVLRASRGE